MSKDIRKYALYCNYPSFEQKLTINEKGNVTLTSGNVSFKKSELAAKIVQQMRANKKSESVALKIETLVSIRDHHNKQRKHFLSFLFHDNKDLKKAIKILDEAIESYQAESAENFTERVFKQRFITRLPFDINIQYPPSSDGEHHEWDIINWLSGQVFNSTAVQDSPKEAQWSRYHEIMKGFYQGDHILIEEKEHYPKISDLLDLEPTIRTSKCYECGRKILSWDPKTGSPEYGSERVQDLKDVKNKHYGITGKHIKHIWFSSLKLYETKDGGWVFGKTTKQVRKIVRSENHCGKTKVRIGENICSVGNVNFQSKKRFVALQMEPAPDSEGNDLFDWRFYANRVHRTVLSFFRKILRFAFALIKVNVGPYGYGRTEYHPVVLCYDTRLRRQFPFSG